MRRELPPGLPELRRLDALGLAKQRSSAIASIASIKRRLMRGDLSELARHNAEYGLLCWGHLPDLIDAVEHENSLGGTDEYNRLRNAIERGVRLMFDADDADAPGDGGFDAAYQHLRECHRRITNYLEGNNHGNSQEVSEVNTEA